MKGTLKLILTFSVLILLAFSVFSSGYPLEYKNGEYYNTDGIMIDGIVSRGIDVSYHQGNIDWEKIAVQNKNGTVDFVILRCGYGADSEEYDDKKFYEYADACVKYKIPFGIYLYSYASDAEGALNEAEHTLRLIKNYKPTYPVFYDVEDKAQAGLDADGYAALIDAFCGKLQENGYETGVYSYRKRFAGEEYFGKIDFDGKNYVKWVAEFNPLLNYSGGFDIWQSGSDRSIEGIDSECDIDYSFMAKRSVDHCYVTFAETEGAEGDFTPLHINSGEKFIWLPAPVKDGYRFVGWYTAKSGGSKITVKSHCPKSGKMTLYARWKKGDGAVTPPTGEAPKAPASSLFDVIRPMSEDGCYMLNGLTHLMEYRIDGGEWFGGASTRIRELHLGQTVEIRYRETETATVGEALALFIHGDSMRRVRAKTPTCVGEGNREYYLDENGNAFASADDYALISDKTSLIIAPTGIHRYRFSCSEECSVCGEKRETEHIFSDDWVGNAEYHQKECLICGKTVTEEHTLSEYFDGDEKGHIQSCTVCGYGFYSEHKWSEATDRGLTHQRSCEICQWFEVAPHIYGTVCSDEEYHWSDCVICGNRKNAEHEMTVREYVEPLCESFGHRFSVCGCGYELCEEIPPTGHIYENGKCVICGSTDPALTSADSEGTRPSEVTDTQTDGKQAGSPVFILIPILAVLTLILILAFYILLAKKPKQT